MTGHRIVDAITRLRITGTVVPWAWLRAIKTPAGHPDLVACFILSDIVFWHRAREIRDDKSGEVVLWVKRFRDDAFQRSIQSWCNMLGASPKQVRTAIARLRVMRLVRTELRKPRIHNESSKGYPTLYYIPNPKAIAAITWPVDNPVDNRCETGVLQGTSRQTGVLQGTDGVLEGTDGVLEGTHTQSTPRVQQEISGADGQVDKSPLPDAEAVRNGIRDFMRGGATVELVEKALSSRYSRVRKVATECEEELRGV